MIFTKPPEKLKRLTAKEMHQITLDDPIKSKLLGQLLSKKLDKRLNRFVISEAIEKDLKENKPVIELMLELARGYMKTQKGYRDVIVKSKFYESVYQIEVRNSEGELLNNPNEHNYNLNLKLHPELSEKEIVITWIAKEAGSDDALNNLEFVATYRSFLEKLTTKVKEMRFK